MDGDDRFVAPAAMLQGQDAIDKDGCVRGEPRCSREWRERHLTGQLGTVEWSPAEGNARQTELEVLFLLEVSEKGSG